MPIISDLPCTSSMHSWRKSKSNKSNRICEHCDVVIGLYGNTVFDAPVIQLPNNALVRVVQSPVVTRLIERDGNWCHYCECDLDEANRTVDHKQPKSRGGTNVPDNLVLACRDCNGDKAHLTYREYQAVLAVRREEIDDAQ